MAACCDRISQLVPTALKDSPVGYYRVFTSKVVSYLAMLSPFCLLLVSLLFSSDYFPDTPTVRVAGCKKGPLF